MAKHVASVREIKSTYSILVGKPDGKTATDNSEILIFRHLRKTVQISDTYKLFGHW